MREFLLGDKKHVVSFAALQESRARGEAAHISSKHAQLRSVYQTVHLIRSPRCSLFLNAVFRQGYGSAFIESGSGSSILRESYPDPIRIQGFDDQNVQLKIFLSFFGSKIAIYLSLGLRKGFPSYRRIRQPSKENIHQSAQNEIY